MLNLHLDILSPEAFRQIPCSRSPGLQIYVLPRLLRWTEGTRFKSDVTIQWHIAERLPVYSDRIAQDSHLIPYYPDLCVWHCIVS